VIDFAGDKIQLMRTSMGSQQLMLVDVVRIAFSTRNMVEWYIKSIKIVGYCGDRTEIIKDLYEW